MVHPLHRPVRGAGHGRARLQGTSRGRCWRGRDTSAPWLRRAGDVAARSRSQRRRDDQLWRARDTGPCGAVRDGLTRPEVDPALIGMFGVSMGATIAIRFASENPGVSALVADCAFSSVEDTVETSVEYFTGLPPFPFASLILFWMERELGVDSDTIDAERRIPNSAPGPCFCFRGAPTPPSRPKRRAALPGGAPAQGTLVRAGAGPCRIPEKTAERFRIENL